MPVGLRRLSALHPAGVPWAWGINGVTSVLASVLAIVRGDQLGLHRGHAARRRLLRGGRGPRRARPLAGAPRPATRSRKTEATSPVS